MAQALTNTLICLGNQELIDTEFPIVTFDLDNTIIQPTTIKVAFEGQLGNAGGDDKPFQQWEFYPGAKEKLQWLNSNKHRVIIFTNQAGISLRKRTVDDFKQQVRELYTVLGFEPTLLAATDYDLWRKPSPCMWYYVMDNYIGENISKSGGKPIIYVGDAAGRDSDFSDSDIKFAANAGFEFTTPDAYFKRLPLTKLPIQGFELHSYMAAYPPFVGPTMPAPQHELVLLVGPPACGKSTFARKYFGTYKYVNQDTINKGASGTYQQCIRAVKASITHSSVIVDNTNASVATRKGYIDIARVLNLPVRIFWFDFPRAYAQHFNNVRAISSYFDNKPRKLIPNMVYNIYYKKLEIPSTDEISGMTVGLNPINVITNCDLSSMDDQTRKLSLLWL